MLYAASHLQPLSCTATLRLCILTFHIDGSIDPQRRDVFLAFSVLFIIGASTIYIQYSVPATIFLHPPSTCSR